MGTENVVDGIAKLFNDFIGAWVPGTVLTFGFAVTHLGPDYSLSIVKSADGVGIGLTIAGLLFALGHLLLAFNEMAVRPLLGWVKFFEVFDENKACQRQSYKWFAETIAAVQNNNAACWSYQDLRSVALSVSTEAAVLGRRFMFLSLLCRGVGTAIAVIVTDYVVCLSFMPELLYNYERAFPAWLQAVVLLGSAFLLFRQGAVFYARAMYIPFSVAIAELKLRARDKEIVE